MPQTTLDLVFLLNKDSTQRQMVMKNALTIQSCTKAMHLFNFTIQVVDNCERVLCNHDVVPQNGILPT